MLFYVRQCPTPDNAQQRPTAKTNIRQRPTTHFASAAGIFNSIVNSGYSRLARTPQGGPRFFYDWHVDVVPVSGVQRIVY